MSRKLTMEEALTEARRCLHCGIPGCRKGCPIENNIPEFIRALREGNIGAAYEIISLRSNLPAICGRVCPHEKQCEAHCVLTRSKRGIQIGSLEMFVADFAHQYGLKPLPKSTGERGKVAVIGSGPAGLTVAGDLAKENFDVTVFEKQSEPGGVLMFGIPEFRLDKEVVRREIEQLRNLGVKFQCNVVAGPDITVDDMFAQGFDAIFMGTGTALPRVLEIPGQELKNVLTAQYYLLMVQLVNNGMLDDKETMLKEGDRVAVIGAGNVAMDAARTAIRRGAKEVTVYFRHTEAEVTAFPTELKAAEAEGVRIQYLSEPVRFISREEMQKIAGKASEGKVSEDKANDTEFPGSEETNSRKPVGGMVLRKLAKDANGEFHPTGGEEYVVCDCVVQAIGNKPAARIVSTTKGIQVDERGFVITRERPYGMTTRAGVFSSGDVVHGPATVVLAMKESKKVAAGIALYVDAKRLISECSL
ncbi:MAG: NAD(P)-dependent oxidoreductase [Acidaminococcaceae bacterium]|nr:NAD(P)-dependent oxidoreductase [Acidaminococcaceae bacterium]MBQ9258013.1 NAD(P)-dependent oxidoreductase [Acidaminococcaceae bacterium]